MTLRVVLILTALALVTISVGRCIIEQRPMTLNTNGVPK